MNARFRRTLRALGFATYEAYLDGPHWRGFRAGFFASGLPSVCRVCGADRVTLHHRTYDRLGCEEFGDVAPLCWRHHKAVHRWLDNSRLGVEATDRAIACLKRRKGRGNARGRANGPRGPRRRS